MNSELDKLETILVYEQTSRKRKRDDIETKQPKLFKTIRNVFDGLPIQEVIEHIELVSYEIFISECTRYLNEIEQMKKNTQSCSTPSGLCKCSNEVIQ